jgi:type I site-specific restriction endonuclease
MQPRERPLDKKSLSETDIRTKFITPAIQAAGWDFLRQVREEVTFTAGRIVVRGRLHSRGKAKRFDYVLYHRPNCRWSLHRSAKRWTDSLLPAASYRKFNLSVYVS